MRITLKHPIISLFNPISGDGNFVIVDVDQDSSETGDITIDVVVDEDADSGDKRLQVRDMVYFDRNGRSSTNTSSCNNSSSDVHFPSPNAGRF